MSGVLLSGMSPAQIFLSLPLLDGRVMDAHVVLILFVDASRQLSPLDLQFR